MERRKASTKKISPEGLSLLHDQKTIIINKIRYYFIIYGKSTMKFK